MDGLITRKLPGISRVDDIAKAGASSKLTVTVLMGGPSRERDISLQSGRAVVEALSGRGCRVFVGDIFPDNLSVLDGDSVANGAVVFPVLHGTFGEDGRLQKILQERGICYAGSDAESSRLAMNKHAAKIAFEKAGILVPRGVLVGGGDVGAFNSRMIVRKVTEALRVTSLPCVVKPNCQGSSIGVVIAENEDIAMAAVAENIDRYGDCLVEQYIQGRELAVGILGGRALPVVEICTKRSFYDYKAKYDDDATRYHFDLDIDNSSLWDIQSQAMRAFVALGCRDFGRVDLIRDSHGHNYFLEVNTIPGFTPHSLLPKAADQAGMTLSEMCEEIVQMAHKHPTHRK